MTARKNETPEEREVRAAYLRQYRAKKREDPEYVEQERLNAREVHRKRTTDDPAYVDARRERKARNLEKRTPAQVEKQRERSAERQRERNRVRRADPGLRAAEREASRILSKKRRQPPEGHPGTCDNCGILPPRKKNGASGLCQDHRHDTGEVRGWLCSRCNNDASFADLRFSDPERFARAIAWSNRSAPPVPVPFTRRNSRKPAVSEPALFDALSAPDSTE